MMSEIFTQYSEELSQKAQAVTKEIAQEFARALKEVTPQSNAATEHLADTIVVTGKKEKSYGKVTESQYVHYTKWQIVHLLEFGWTARNGVRVERQPFIRPLFDSKKEMFYNKYKEILSK